VSLAYQFTVSGHGLTTGARVKAALQPRRVGAVAGRAATNVLRAHLFARNADKPNALGGKRTNYYAQAARSTSYAFDGDDAVVVSINQIGIRLRYYGGTVKPRTAKFLTIPVAPEAHGKRAREFGNLEVVFGAKGQPIGLALKVTSTTTRRRRAGESGPLNPFERQIGNKRNAGKLLYRLVKSATFAADPTVLPLPDVLMGGVISAINAHLDRALQPPPGRPPTA
jgi:hypothetical protein